MDSNSITGRFKAYRYKQSSVQDYFNAVREVKSIDDFFHKTGDFFPYINDNPKNNGHCFWTGYFVSTPYAKKLFRSFSEATRGLKSLLSLWLLRGEKDDIYTNEITSQADISMWRLGLNTHHDTITGTSPQVSADTYRETTELQFDSLNTTFNLFVSKYFWKEDFYSNSQNISLLNPFREGAIIDEEHLYLLISQGGQKKKMIRVRSNKFDSLFPIEFDTGLNPKVVTTCNFKKVCEHVFFDDFLTAQGKFFYFSKAPNVSFIEKKMMMDTEYAELVSGKYLKFSIVSKNSRFQFIDGKNTMSFALMQYLYRRDSPTSSCSNGKYMFTSSIPVELVKIDNDDLKYVVQKKGDGCPHILYGRSIRSEL